MSKLLHQLQLHLDAASDIPALDTRHLPAKSQAATGHTWQILLSSGQYYLYGPRLPALSLVWELLGLWTCRICKNEHHGCK